ncbi:MAG: TonB family protein [Candidatus Krumholzibacteriaceae bacterium]|jgi:TonB family protein
MRSSAAISVILHGLVLGALVVQWHAVTAMHIPEGIYSVRLLGPVGGSGSPGNGPGGDRVRITTSEGATKKAAARKDEPTTAVPKEKETSEDKSAVKPEPKVAAKDYDVGEPEGEVLPLQGGGGGGGGGSGGGGWGGGSGAGGGGGYGVRNAIVEPKLLYIPWPKYPAGVKPLEHGSVELLLLVNTRGEVEDLKVTRSLPIEQLNAIAVQAARKIRFTPGFNNGVRTPMWVRLSIDFQPR